jgi:outer membrane protein TolC
MKIRMKKVFVFLGIVLVSPLMLLAQDASTDTVSRISLDEAVNYAMKNNRDIKNSQLDVESAKKKVWETTAIGLPQASVKYDYSYIFDEGIELPFTDPTTGNPSMIEFKPTSNLSFQASQLVFSGEYIVGLKTAKIFKSLSSQNVIKTEQNTKEAVTNAYIMILVLRENESILKENLETLKRNIFEMSEMYKAGYIEDTDVDQLRISEKNIESVLINVSRQTELAIKLLKLNMGMSLNQKLVLTQDLESTLTQMISGSLELMQFDVDQNIDYQLFSTQRDLKEMEFRQQQVKFLPTVSGFYSHIEKFIKPEFDMTPSDLVGLSVSLPLFTSGQRGSKVQQARIALDKLDNSQDALRDGLNMQFEQAMVDYNSAFRKYLNEKDNTILTKKIYDKTLIKYREGLSSSLDLSQIQSQQLQSQTNLYNAILELVQAKTKLDKLSIESEK